MYSAKRHRQLIKAHKAATTKEERDTITRELLALLAAGGNAGAAFVQRAQAQRRAA